MSFVKTQLSTAERKKTPRPALAQIIFAFPTLTSRTIAKSEITSFFPTTGPSPATFRSLTTLSSPASPPSISFARLEPIPLPEESLKSYRTSHPSRSSTETHPRSAESTKSVFKDVGLVTRISERSELLTKNSFSRKIPILPTPLRPSIQQLRTMRKFVNFLPLSKTQNAGSSASNSIREPTQANWPHIHAWYQKSDGSRNCQTAHS